MNKELQDYKIKILKRVDSVPTFHKSLLYRRLQGLNDLKTEHIEPIETFVSELLFDYEAYVNELLDYRKLLGYKIKKK